MNDDQSTLRNISTPLAPTSFIHEGFAARVIFGSGTLSRIAPEIEQLGCSRALVLSTPEQAGQAEVLSVHLGGLSIGFFAGAVMHTPVDVTERAMAKVRVAGADCVVSIGGGSTIGLGKAIALRTDLPQIAVPTTYAGSEVTPILGETVGGRKTTQRTPKVLPEVVVYDVDLTLTLPARLSAVSGLNAIAHSVEALYSREASPIVALMAEASIGALARALPAIMADASDRAARAEALYGAWLAGTCLAGAGMALHHKLCHVLGAAFDLPHAETHAVVLPHVVAFNGDAAPAAMHAIRRALGAQDPADGLRTLADRLGAPKSLASLGMPVDGVGRAVDLATRDPYWNPRPIEPGPLATLISRAQAGFPPAPI